MHVKLVCPAPPRSTTGNRITALRWQKLLRELGHRVSIDQQYDGSGCDVLVAMHARRSAEAVFLSRELAPRRPIIVALTGTDLYRDIHQDHSARRALEMADRYVLLQPAGRSELPAKLRARARVIHQSAERPRVRRKRRSTLQFVLVGHLRPEKDPFRALEALKLLGRGSRIRIIHAGGAIDPVLARRARRASGDRYRWIGEVSPRRARRLIAESDALLLTSIMEGGANVLSEAIVAGIPIQASRIPSSVAILGARYPGFFTTGNTAELAVLMRRFETDARFRQALQSWIRRLAPKFHPSREKKAWKELLSEVSAAGPAAHRRAGRPRP